MSRSTDTYLKAHVLADVDPEILRLISLASFDLYFGPIGPVDDDDKPWPGFAKSCELIAAAIDLRERWVADYDEVRDSEPDWTERMEPDEGENEGCLAYCPDDWTHYESRDVRRVVLGELGSYV